MSSRQFGNATNVRNGVLSFFNKLHIPTFKPTTKNSHAYKTATKDSEWMGLVDDYDHLLENLDLYDLDGKVVLATENDINFKGILKSCKVQNPEVACLTCMDEGIQYVSNSKNTIPIAIPGCGILMESVQDELRANILSVLKKYDIKKLVIDAHVKCGAANIAAKAEFPKISCIHSRDFIEKFTELVAEDYAQHLASNLLEEYEELQVNSNYIKDLHRPDFHNAVGVIVNFDTQTNSSMLIEKLGIPFFVLSAFVLNDDSLAADDLLAYDIATGQHGFEEKFCPDEPFLVLCITNGKQQKARALEVMSGLEKKDCIKYSILEV